MLIIYTKRRTGTSQESKRGTTQTSKNKHERHALWFLLCALCGCFLPVSNIKNIRLMNKLSLRPRAALNIFLSITSSFFTLFFAISLKYPCKDCTSASLKLVVSTNCCEADMGMTRKRWKEWEEEENEKKQCHMTHRLTTPQERMRDGKGETKTHEATLPFLSNLWPCLFPIVMSLPVDKCSMEVRRRD